MTGSITTFGATDDNNVERNRALSPNDGSWNMSFKSSGTQVPPSGLRSLGQTGEMLSRKDRIQVFGIDCNGPNGDGILFKGGEWAPGGEYVQHLRVKNVSPKLKKLKYRLPISKRFLMPYPEVIILSPGTMQEINVVFRPLSSQVYEDVIFFKVLDGPNAGGFNVRVQALLPTLQVSIPEGLDFGYCQANECCSRTFQVKNIGEVPAPFSWEVPPPFVMSPSEGVTAVGTSTTVTCSLRATDASVFVSRAVLTVGHGVNAIKPEPFLEMKVSAVGKYCYVVASEKEVDFGSQTAILGTDAAGRGQAACTRKEFTLRNQSVVPAIFTVMEMFTSWKSGTRLIAFQPLPSAVLSALRDISLEDDREPVFSLQPAEGIIPPEDETVITVTYPPVSAGTFSRDHYEIATVGGNKVTVAVQGRAVGCTVRLEKKQDPFARGCGIPDSVNFREVEVGVTTSRVVYLYNETSEPCRFCFSVEGNSSIFRFSCTRGLIPSAGSEHPGESQIIVTFNPRMPCNYYRRIFCLLENQLPLVLDMMGTGYINARGETEEQRPAPLRQAHVQAFRNRQNVGLGRCSPQELEDVLETERMGDLLARVGPEGTQPLQRCGISKPQTRSGEATRAQTAVSAEFFMSSEDAEMSEVYLDRSCVDFGLAAADRVETVTVNNNTNTEVYVVWNFRDFAGGDAGGGALSISPLVADIAAGDSFSFRVSLSSSKGNCYFTEEAEAFVSPSNQRTFRMVKDATLQPPWCLTLRVLGHTFLGEQFLAKASLSTHQTGHKLCFPACHLGDTVYQTIRLSNQGNISAFFSFQLDPSRVFDIKPAVGLIPAGDFQICLLSFTPPGLGSRRYRLECVLNNDPGSSLNVELFGQGAMPTLRAESSGPEERDPGMMSLDGSSAWDSDTEGVASERTMVYMRPSCIGLVASGTFKVKNSSRIPAIFTIDPPKASSGVLKITPLAGLLLGNQATSVELAFAPRGTKEYRFKLPVKVRSILGEAPVLTDCRQLGEATPTVPRSGTHVTVVGQGERGAVAFHPSSLTFAVRLVNTSESKALILENCSECDVNYKLFYIANGEPLAHPRPATDREGGDYRVEPSELRPVPKENGEAKGHAGPSNMDALFIDRPQGTLPARSRTKTIATFRPVAAGDYDFSILCQVIAAGGVGYSTSGSQIHADMVEQGNRSRTAAARLEGLGYTPAVGNHDKRHGDECGEDLGTEKEDAVMMPLRCEIKGRASFPTIIVRDVRITKCKGEDVIGTCSRNLWSALSLSRMNTMLNEPLSEEDVRFNQESSPDTSKLPRFAVPFVPTVIGTGPVVISLQVCNPGFLLTSFTINLPNAKPVEMETWANEGEPTAEELRQNDVIDRLKAFTIIPSPGTTINVAAGKHKVLTLAYSADSLSYGGLHDLPILVRIKEGRQFWLDLKGITLRPQYPMLYIPTGLAREFVLEPVALGTPLTETPLQITELLNVGEASLSYVVDLQGIIDANSAQGHGVPVFRLEDNCGTIPGGGYTFLRWRFLPIERREYVLRVTIRMDDGRDTRFEEQSMEITLRGTGYDPRTRDPHSEELPPVNLGLVHPARQLEIETGQTEQICALSLQRLRLGRIQQGALLSRMFFMKNCSADTAVDFTWDPSDIRQPIPLTSSGIVSVHPLKGRLDAKQSRLFRLTVSAECGPRFLGPTPLACLVRQAPPSQVIRCRQPKSRLESRLEEEKLARSKPPEPREPVVSRPTASRTHHMADVLRGRSLCGSKESVRQLVPHYPSSSMNPAVPHVLALAMKESQQKSGSTVGIKSKSLEENKQGKNFEVQDWEGEDMNLQNSGSLMSNGQFGQFGQIGHGLSDSHTSKQQTTPSFRGATCVLRLELEGEVLSAETCKSLFCWQSHAHDVQGRDGGHGPGGDESLDHGTSQDESDKVLVPQPIKHIPDWAALDCRNDGTKSGKESVSTLQSTASGGDPYFWMKRSSADPLAKKVTSRVIRRLVEDVVTSDEVKRCFKSLPSTARVTTLEEIQTAPSLQDRLADELALYLPTSDPTTSQPAPPTAAAATVQAVSRLSIDWWRINRNSAIDKGVLVSAFNEASRSNWRRMKSIGLDTTCIHTTPVVSSKSSLETSPLMTLAHAVQALPGPQVTLADLVSSLDNTTVQTIESWFEQRLPGTIDESTQNRPTPTTNKATCETDSVAIDPMVDEAIDAGELLETTRDITLSNTEHAPKDTSILANASAAAHSRVEFVWKFMTCLIRNALEMHCVLHIVAVARTHFSQHLNEAIVSCVRPQRLQDSQTKEAPSEVILSGFGDQACRSPRTQRIIMAALNGTFFNLMQDAVDGRVNLGKLPKHFAIRKPPVEHNSAKLKADATMTLTPSTRKIISHGGALPGADHNVSDTPSLEGKQVAGTKIQGEASMVPEHILVESIPSCWSTKY